MKRIYLILFLSIFSFFALVHPVSSASAQVFKMQLANPSQTINVGDTVTVNILINTNNIATINGDALVVFDPAKTTITGGASSNFFTYFSQNPLSGSANKYLISSWEETIAHAKTSSTDTPFATFTFRPLVTGTTSFSFDCSGTTGADSNINRASDSADIIQCASLTPLSITVGTGTSLSPTPTTPGGTILTPTRTPTPTTGSGSTSPSSTPVPTVTTTPKPSATKAPSSTPRPTSTPRAGSGGSTSGGSNPPAAGAAGITVAVLGFGTLLTVIGILAIL